jgi:pimeloyl-ACP methyl ester carboxylesterase
VKTSQPTAGISRNGLPYNRLGQGTKVLIVFNGLQPESKPLYGLNARMMLRTYDFLREEYTSYVMGRRPGLPEGYSLKDMADDYAKMVQEELQPPVDVIGLSTGGSIAFHFAADHPDLVRRLVLHSSAHALSEEAREGMKRVAHLARAGRWREAMAVMLGYTNRPSWANRVSAAVGSVFMALMAPEDPSDLIVTIEAEDKLDFRERLREIAAPTLVIAGDQDRFYSETLFRETAQGIPNAKLVLYQGMGHPARGRQFARDVISFLT